MTDNIQTLLDELYTLDPELRAHETALRPLIERLLATEVAVPLTPQFAAELRRNLLHTPPRQSWRQALFSPMKKLPFILSGAAVATVLLVPLLYTTLGQNPSGAPLLLGTIRHAGTEAFGTLSIPPGAPAGAENFGGGERSALAMNGIADNMAGSLIAPPMLQYAFLYRGEPIENIPATLPVYKRSKGLDASARSAAATLMRLPNGLLDLTKFQGAGLRSFELVQKSNDGHTVYVNLEEGSISVNPTHEVRPEEISVPLTIDQVPSDDKIIKAAADFATSLGINLSRYGEPQVQNAWLIHYANTRDKSEYYIPDFQSVVFPEKINGEVVYDQSGNAYGLQVNVNVRTLKGSGLWNLLSARYESSDYTMETNANRLTEIAERGGVYGFMYGGNPAERIEVSLGTPRFTLTQVWHYDEKTGMGAELFVPALVFPIENAPADFPAYQTSVIVPLAKDILDNTPDARPIQILKEAATDTPAAAPVRQ